MRVSVTGLSAFLFLVGAGAAQSGDLVFLDNPTWLNTPTVEQMAGAYPSGRVRSGQVTLLCAANRDGTLKNCDVQSELPQGQGFAKAAQSLAPLFKADVGEISDHQLPRILIVVPVHFTAPGDRDATRTSTDPAWVGTPELQDAFPAKAAQAGTTTGKAVLECTSDRHGLMTDCQVLDETPAGEDFGPAALHVAAAMSVNPWIAPGLPAEGERVKFAIRLNRDDASSPSKGQ